MIVLDDFWKFFILFPIGLYVNLSGISVCRFIWWGGQIITIFAMSFELVAVVVTVCVT